MSYWQKWLIGKTIDVLFWLRYEMFYFDCVTRCFILIALRGVLFWLRHEMFYFDYVTGCFILITLPGVLFWLRYEMFYFDCVTRCFILIPSRDVLFWLRYRMFYFACVTSIFQHSWTVGIDLWSHYWKAFSLLPRERNDSASFCVSVRLPKLCFNSDKWVESRPTYGTGLSSLFLWNTAEAIRWI